MTTARCETDIKDILLERPLLIAGPCSAESEKQVMAGAMALSALGIPVFRAGLWKPRTKPGGFEGVGEEGLPWMRRVKETTGMLTATEVGRPEHVERAVAGGIDLLWIGARTAANPFAVQDICDALAALPAPPPVLLKNPVNPDVELWSGGVERLRRAGIEKLILVHRGFTVYGNHLYRNQPVWSVPIEMHRRFPELPIICDPSHIAGRADLVQPLSQEALDMGFNGLMVETHISPSEARSDASQQLTPQQFERMLKTLRFRQPGEAVDDLYELRRAIDDCDAELLSVLSRRMQISREIGAFKRERNMPAVQISRHDSIMSSRVEAGLHAGLSERFVRKLMALIHEESVHAQIRILNAGKKGEDDDAF